MKLPEHEPDVVARAAQHGMQPIAERALERIAGQPAIGFHVPNGRLDGTSPLDHGLHGSGDAPALA